MFLVGRIFVLLLSFALAQDLAPEALPPSYQESDASAVDQYFDEQRKQGKQVVSVGGFSALGYQDEAAAERELEKRLRPLSRKNTIINGGVTQDGIGDITYRVAKRMGFQTAGIVSAKALADPKYLKVSNGIDKTFFVKDSTWGGRKEDGKLSDTSEAWVRNSDRYIGLGGGAIGRDEMEEMVRCLSFFLWVCCQDSVLVVPGEARKARQFHRHGGQPREGHCPPHQEEHDCSHRGRLSRTGDRRV